MSTGLQQIAERILSATNGGLDIIQELYPTADPRKNFSIREDDRHPSASVKRFGDRFRVTDFSGSVRAQDCFGIWALQNNCDYWEAIVQVADAWENRLGMQLLNKSRETYKWEYAEFKPEDCPAELNDKGFTYKKRELTDLDLKILGPEILTKAEGKAAEPTPFITREICEEENFYALEEYYHTSESKGKVMRFRATENFPIYAFINNDPKIGEWMKIYMPKGKKSLNPEQRDYRFWHVGGRPKNFVFGLERITKLYNEKCEKAIEEFYLKIEKQEGDKLTEDEKKEYKKAVDFKFKRIVIASGGSDGFNLRACGEYVIWKNSETDDLDEFTMNELFKMAEDVVNVPDTDKTGKMKGKEIALEHLTLKTVWLEEHTGSSRIKDFKDFTSAFKYLGKTKLINKVGHILDIAKPAQFWDVTYSDKGRPSYNFNQMFGFYFLRLNGFCLVLDDSRKEGYWYARVNGHVVEELKTTQPIKDFFKNFLAERQKSVGIRKIPYALINSLMSSQKLNDSTLGWLHKRDIDFSDYTWNSQYFFFNHAVWKVTAEKIEEVQNFDRYVLKNQIIDELVKFETDHTINSKEIKIEEKPYFEIQAIGEGLYDIEIHEKDCDFLNYLVQTSRVYWNVEKENCMKQGWKEEEFYEKTMFNIAGPTLSADQIEEQKNHLVNKIFVLGYLLHRYKDASKPWVPYAVDNAVQDEKTADGGSGKSVYFNCLNYLSNVFTVNGKDDIERDNFWLEGVTKHTDMIMIDDVKRSFSLEWLYQITTGNISINAKFQAKEKLKKKDVPKISVSSNYALREMNGSAMRRRLLISFSDYYHARNEERSERQPINDFGYKFFDDWDDVKWNRFFNFMMQCLQFYLRTNAKIEAPDNNILRRAWRAEMGEWFEQWAREYVPNHLNVAIVKTAMEENMQNYNPKFLTFPSNTFKKKLDAFCKYYGYDYTDRDIRTFNVDEHDRIVQDKKLSVRRKSFEMITLQLKNSEQTDTTILQDENSNSEENELF